MTLVFYLFRMAVIFVTVATLMVNWRVSLTLLFCVYIDFVGIIVSTAPPNNIWNQALGYALLGVIHGAIVSAPGRRDRDIRRLPFLAAFLMFALTVSWGADFKETLGLWWLYFHRVIAMPAAMLAVIELIDRHKLRKQEAQ